MADIFHCSLVTPERQVLDETVTYASIPAWDGQIGLMHQRAPLLAKLGDGLLRLEFAEGGSRWFFVAGGFAQMKNDNLSILTQEAMAAEEVVRKDAEAAMEKARAIVPISDEEFERRQRGMSRAQAMLQLLDHLSAKA